MATALFNAHTNAMLHDLNIGRSGTVLGCGRQISFLVLHIMHKR